LRKSELGDPIILVDAYFWANSPHVFEGYVGVRKQEHRDTIIACWRGLEHWVRLFFWFRDLRDLEWRYSAWLVRRGIWQLAEEDGYYRDSAAADYPARRRSP
jgi:hypothetical protein